MSNSTTNVSYQVIDECINNLNQRVNDYSIQVELGRLSQLFCNSNGSTLEEIKETVKDLQEAHKFVVDMMIELQKMLMTAKSLFQNLDNDMSLNIGGKGEA